MSHDVSRRVVPPAFERYRELIDDWPSLVDALGTPLPTCVWVNPKRSSSDELVELLSRGGYGPRPIDWRQGAFRLTHGDGIGTEWWYLAGLGHIQEEASLLPIALLDARPGQRVLDLCAAPGGKTAEIALALGNRGTVVANDVSLTRMRSLRDTIDRLGLINVTVTRGDGGNIPAERAGGFDRVLVDAPCSGEGTLRKQYGKGARFGPSVSLAYRGRQIALLRKAVQLCRPGGRVVYSTCTFAPEENESVVDTVLHQEAGRGLQLVPASLRGLVTRPGITEWDGGRFDSSLARAVRLWPHDQDTGGFFAAIIEKTGDAELPDPEEYAWDPADPAEWTPHVLDRFGIPTRAMEPYRIHRRSSRGPHLVARDHRASAVPEPEAIGIRFMNVRARFPKLTTPGATVLGPDATRNVVDLDDEQVGPYIARATIEMRTGQSAGCAGTGTVLVRFRGHVLGLALRREGSAELTSYFPKRWANAAPAESGLT